MEERPEEPEQMVMFDNMSFRLVMDGIWASVHLHDKNPKRGMTREEATERLQVWFPEASIEIDQAS